MFLSGGPIWRFSWPAPPGPAPNRRPGKIISSDDPASCDALLLRGDHIPRDRAASRSLPTRGADGGDRRHVRADHRRAARRLDRRRHDRPQERLSVVGPLATSGRPAFNTPEEWGRGCVGHRQTLRGARGRRRHLEHDRGRPRRAVGRGSALHPVRPQRHLAARALRASRPSLLAQGRDGHLRPAWGRYAGNTLNNLIENAWLPPSLTTPAKTALRSGLGMLSRLGGNAWEEFWPDVVRRFRKK